MKTLAEAKLFFARSAATMGCPTPAINDIAGLPGSSAVLSMRAVHNRPGRFWWLLAPVSSPPVAGFIFFGDLATLQMCNEAESVRFLYGSHVRLARLHSSDYSDLRLLGYLVNG